MQILVLLTANISLSDWETKGILRRELSIYNNLKKKYQFTFLTYGDSRDNKFKKIKYFNIINIYNKKKFLRIFKIIYPLFFIIKNHKYFKKFKIVKSNQLLGAHLGILIKILYKSKFICRMGYDPNFFYSKEEKKIFRKFFLKIYSIIVYYFADKIIVTTSEMKFFLVNNFNQDKNKIFINPNYVDTKLFNNKLISNKKINKLVTVARFDDQKNLIFLFNQINITNCTLDIIGPSKEANKFLNLIKKFDTKKINFLGTIKHEQLNAKYKNYDAFILLSKYEGNPKSLLEAMSSKLIIIASNVSGINNIIINKKNGFLLNFTDGELPSLINDLNNKKYNLNKIRNNGRSFVLNNNSLNNISRNEEFIYCSVLKI